MERDEEILMLAYSHWMDRISMWDAARCESISRTSKISISSITMIRAGQSPLLHLFSLYFSLRLTHSPLPSFSSSTFPPSSLFIRDFTNQFLPRSSQAGPSEPTPAHPYYPPQQPGGIPFSLFLFFIFPLSSLFLLSLFRLSIFSILLYLHFYLLLFFKHLPLYIQNTRHILPLLGTLHNLYRLVSLLSSFTSPFLSVLYSSSLLPLPFFSIPSRL